MKTMTIEELAIILRDERHSAQRRINAYAGLLANPFNDALDIIAWSDDIIVAAARLDVANNVLQAINRPHSTITIDSLTAFAHGQVQQGARFPKNSTSELMNLTSRAQTAAWAELVASLTGE